MQRLPFESSNTVIKEFDKTPWPYCFCPVQIKRIRTSGFKLNYTFAISHGAGRMHSSKTVTCTEETLLSGTWNLNFLNIKNLPPPIIS